jgi:hypothetical protein
MKKNLMALVVLILAAAGLTLMAQDAKPARWTGIVTDQMCTKMGVKLTDAACAAKCVAAGSKYALYETATKRVYVLDMQDEAAKFAGQTVSVRGTMDGDTIKVASIKAAKAS